MAGPGRPAAAGAGGGLEARAAVRLWQPPGRQDAWADGCPHHEVDRWRRRVSTKRPAHLAGIHPETSSLMNVLAGAGVTAPHTGKPFTEAMLLGVGGGVSFNYYVFQYKGWTPTLFISGRYLLQDNVAFLEGACRRLGVGTTVKESTSPKVAEKNLISALESGPVIAWVDLGSLSYAGLPPPLRRMMYYVVNVYGVGEDAGVA